MVGDIYLAKIYFTNLSEYKVRPVLVIKRLGADYICLQLTSQLKGHKLIINNKDLTKGKNKQTVSSGCAKKFHLTWVDTI